MNDRAMPRSIPRILSIAGSDSGGGAGIQADIKTITICGGFAMTAITAITAQNTKGVEMVEAVSTMMIRRQIKAVLEDIGVDAIKIGMLGSAEIMSEIASTLREHQLIIPIIVDPVMQAKGGASLINDGADKALAQHVLPLSTLVTPNIPEAEALSGIEIHTTLDMKRAAGIIIERYNISAILVTGGHSKGDLIEDVLLSADTYEVFETPRIDSKHTHGTGCTLSSAIACFLGKGYGLSQAVKEAQHYIQGAIINAPKYGAGHGPMQHGWILSKDT